MKALKKIEVQGFVRVCVCSQNSVSDCQKQSYKQINEHIENGCDLGWIYEGTSIFSICVSE